MKEKQNIQSNKGKLKTVTEEVPKENLIELPDNQPKTMEVHHHPELKQKRKHLKEYFLEFLMIFLAVTLGFFAEQIREAKAEEKKAKEFARLLIRDIEADIINYQAQAQYNKRKEDKIDTLLQLLSHPVLFSQHNDVYYYSAFLTRFNNDVYYYSAFLTKFIPNVPFDATFQQLKSSGSLRYFKNAELVYQISHYYLNTSVLAQGFYGTVNENLLKIEANKIISKVLKNNYFMETNIKDSFHFTYNVKRPVSRTTLLSTDPDLINQLSAFARMEKEESEFVRIITMDILQKAVDLSKNLKKEYNLK